MVEGINSVSTRDMPLAYAGQLLAGRNGHYVNVTVLRLQHPEPQTIDTHPRQFTFPGGHGQNDAR